MKIVLRKFRLYGLLVSLYERAYGRSGLCPACGVALARDFAVTYTAFRDPQGLWGQCREGRCSTCLDNNPQPGFILVEGFETQTDAARFCAYKSFRPADWHLWLKE